MTDSLARSAEALLVGQGTGGSGFNPMWGGEEYESACPISMWRSVYSTVQDVAGAWTEPMTPRQRGEHMVRELCRTCRDYLNHKHFWCHYRYNADLRSFDHINTGEIFLISLFATHDPNQIIQWMREWFPDEDYPVERLNPFLKPEVRTVTIVIPPLPDA